MGDEITDAKTLEILESKICKYCKKEFYKKEFPKNFNRMITCGSKECREKYKKGWMYSKNCLDCGKPIIRYAKRCKYCSSKGKNNPFYGKTHTEKIKKKLKLLNIGKKQSKEHIRKRFQRRIPSSLELKMIQLIKEHNLPYKFVGDGSFFIERLNPDFINYNGKKIAIEVYYRKHKELYQGGLENWKTRRIEIFKKYGWDIIFLDETKVNKYVVEKLL